MKYPCSTNFVNRPFLYSLFSLLLLLIWGCKQEVDFQYLPSDTQLSLSSVGKGGLQANAGQPSAASHSFGLFMGASGAPNANDMLESNREYTYTASNIGLVGSPIYYPQSGDVRLFAYTPYNSGLTGHILPIDISDQSDLSKIDLLYSNNNAAVNKNSGAVNLSFGHTLSKIKFALQAGQGIPAEQLAQVEVDLKGFHTQAGFNLFTGALVAPTALADLSIGQSREAIVLPSESSNTAGRVFEFKLGGQTWSYNLPNTDTFQPGQEYQYAITFQAKTIKVERLSIAAWEQSGSSTGTKPSSIEFVQILPGKFQMGSPESDVDAKDSEKPQHWRHVDKSFLMSKHLITRQQYCDYLYETNADYQNPGGSSADILDKVDGVWRPKVGEENYPITFLTFLEAKDFAAWAGGALPTEVQWEYACRAGTTTRWSFGDNLTDYDQYVVPKGTITNVGTKLPNPWGLYDMHGLVDELCYWVDSYPTPPTTEENPIIGIGQIDDFIFEQASRGHYSDGRSASRGRYSSFGRRASHAGFRIVINQE